MLFAEALVLSLEGMSENEAVVRGLIAIESITKGCKEVATKCQRNPTCPVAEWNTVLQQLRSEDAFSELLGQEPSVFDAVSYATVVNMLHAFQQYVRGRGDSLQAVERTQVATAADEQQPRFEELAGALNSGNKKSLGKFVDTLKDLGIVVETSRGVFSFTGQLSMPDKDDEVRSQMSFLILKELVTLPEPFRNYNLYRGTHEVPPEAKELFEKVRLSPFFQELQAAFNRFTSESPILCTLPTPDDQGITYRGLWAFLVPLLSIVAFIHTHHNVGGEEPFIPWPVLCWAYTTLPLATCVKKTDNELAQAKPSNEWKTYFQHLNAKHHGTSFFAFTFDPKSKYMEAPRAPPPTTEGPQAVALSSSKAAAVGQKSCYCCGSVVSNAEFLAHRQSCKKRVSDVVQLDPDWRAPPNRTWGEWSQWTPEEIAGIKVLRKRSH